MRSSTSSTATGSAQSPRDGAVSVPEAARLAYAGRNRYVQPRFCHSGPARQLTSRYGEKFTLATGPVLPLGNYPGDATALQMLGGGRAQAVAGGYRRGGGSALGIDRPGPARRRRC
ncbi:MAG TPA: hypothetical protein VFN55_04670 [Solirubrobacteraceae bacterium]|nr:hypothetical protein [Solirubrobacteraceae bacterium]